MMDRRRFVVDHPAAAHRTSGASHALEPIDVATRASETRALELSDTIETRRTEFETFHVRQIVDAADTACEKWDSASAKNSVPDDETKVAVFYDPADAT